MRGVATAFLLAFLIAMAVIIGIFAVTLPTGKTETRIMQEELYTLQNALYAAKSYVETAARYSVYQACYDVLKSGQSLSEEQIISNLEGNITKNMAVYTSSDYNFLTGYNVKLPAYEAKLIYKDPNKVTLHLTSDKNLIIEKERKDMPVSSKTRLEKKSEMILDVQTSCYGISAPGIAYMDNIKYNLEGIFNQKISSLSLPKTINKRFEKAGVTCETAFEEEMGRSFGDVQTEIKNYLDNYLKSYSDILKGSSEVKINYEIMGKESSEDYTIINCKYEYIANFNIEVTFSGSEKYPVWNGTDISFEPLKAVFKSQINIKV